jgi:hypothetical protein
MAYYIFATQRTNRHIVKKLASDVAPAMYVNSFGAFQVPGGTSSTLHNPWGIVAASGGIFVCDSVNKRIVKLDNDLTYVSEYSTVNTIDEPYSIMCDISSGDLYVVGVYNNRWVRVERLTTSLVSVRVSGNLHADGLLLYRPTGISKGFAAGSFLVVGANNDIFETIETASFSTFVTRAIVGETAAPYNSIIKHSNGNLYVNNGQKIIKVNSSFTNVGDSDYIAKSIFGLKEAAGNSILTYAYASNSTPSTIIRFSENMYRIEDVYYTMGGTVDVDAEQIADFVELSI